MGVAVIMSMAFTMAMIVSVVMVVSGMTMTMTVVMSVVMIVRCMTMRGMAVRMATMIVTCVRVSKSQQTNHVDQETECADNQQLLDVAKLSSLHHAFNGLPYELHTDKHEENTIAKSGQHVELAPAIRLFWTGRPLACHRRSKTDHEC